MMVRQWSSVFSGGAGCDIMEGAFIHPATPCNRAEIEKS